MAGKLYGSPRFRVSGDRALLVEYGEGVDLEVNEKVRTVTELLRKDLPSGVESVLPAYRSLAIVYSPLIISPPEIEELILALEANLPNTPAPASLTVEIPVCYGGVFGPDIQFVAETNGLSAEEVIAIHSAAAYHIYAIGFSPGFCYLGGLDARLHTPRLETPRTLVPAGSVGIAESQTGVYPLASPGGWRLIGRTPLKLFDPESPSPFLYKAGDAIKFKPISISLYETICSKEAQ